jgi:hypothetical protein
MVGWTRQSHPWAAKGSAKPIPTALATTVRRDAPDPIRRPFAYHNVGAASPEGRYGFLPETFPTGYRSPLPVRPGIGRGLEKRDAPTSMVDRGSRIGSGASLRTGITAAYRLSMPGNESGQAEEALAALDRARPLYRKFSDDFTKLRLHRLEGKIAANLGDLAGAESILGQLWEEFLVRAPLGAAGGFCVRAGRTVAATMCLAPQKQCRGRHSIVSGAIALCLELPQCR